MSYRAVISLAAVAALGIACFATDAFAARAARGGAAAARGGGAVAARGGAVVRRGAVAGGAAVVGSPYYGSGYCDPNYQSCGGGAYYRSGGAVVRGGAAVGGVAVLEVALPLAEPPYVEVARVVPAAE